MMKWSEEVPTEKGLWWVVTDDKDDNNKPALVYLSNDWNGRLVISGGALMNCPPSEYCRGSTVLWCKAEPPPLPMGFGR